MTNVDEEWLDPHPRGRGGRLILAGVGTSRSSHDYVSVHLRLKICFSDINLPPPGEGFPVIPHTQHKIPPITQKNPSVGFSEGSYRWRRHCVFATLSLPLSRFCSRLVFLPPSLFAARFQGSGSRGGSSKLAVWFDSKRTSPEQGESN